MGGPRTIATEGTQSSIRTGWGHETGPTSFQAPRQSASGSIAPFTARDRSSSEKGFGMKG